MNVVPVRKSSSFRYTGFFSLHRVPLVIAPYSLLLLCCLKSWWGNKDWRPTMKFEYGCWCWLYADSAVQKVSVLFLHIDPKPRSAYREPELAGYYSVTFLIISTFFGYFSRRLTSKFERSSIDSFISMSSTLSCHVAFCHLCSINIHYRAAECFWRHDSWEML